MIIHEKLVNCELKVLVQIKIRDALLKKIIIVIDDCILNDLQNRIEQLNIQ